LHCEGSKVLIERQQKNYVSREDDGPRKRIKEIGLLNLRRPGKILQLIS